MIIRVLDEKKANICDDLLTKLILDERKYDDSIDTNFKVKDYFKSVIINKDNILLAYEDNGIICGYIYLKLVNSESENSYLIDGLYVDEMFRNKGIATKLLNEAIIVIKDSNIKHIDINVLADNTIAYKLYKSMGFNDFKISLRKHL